MRPQKPPTAISETLFKFTEVLAKRKKYVKNEYQAYGLELADELGDWAHKSLFIRLAKNTPRDLLEKARYFVRDHNPGAIQAPYKLFMWKLKELKKVKEISTML